MDRQHPGRTRIAAVSIATGYRCRVAAWMLVVASIGQPAFLLAADALSIEVSAGSQDRLNVPVTMDLPEVFKDVPHFTLTRLSDEKPVAVQKDRGAGRSSGFSTHWLPAKQRPIASPPAAEAAEPDSVSVGDDGKRLSVSIAGKPVLVYNQAVVPSPIAKEPYYAKSGYIHPVYDPAGQLVTDDFNPEHAHQHGIMFAWRAITFEGRESNGWDQKAGTGRVEHLATDGFGSGPVFGWFDVRLQQIDLTAPGGPKPVLEDRWRAASTTSAIAISSTSDPAQTCGRIAGDRQRDPLWRPDDPRPRPVARDQGF